MRGASTRRFSLKVCTPLHAPFKCHCYENNMSFQFTHTVTLSGAKGLLQGQILPLRCTQGQNDIFILCCALLQRSLNFTVPAQEWLLLKEFERSDTSGCAFRIRSWSCGFLRGIEISERLSSPSAAPGRGSPSYTAPSF
jgi:hypothetical protein